MKIKKMMMPLVVFGAMFFSLASVNANKINSVSEIQKTRFARYTKLNADAVSVSFSIVKTDDSVIDLGSYSGTTVGEVIASAEKANNVSLYNNCPDGYVVYSPETGNEYTSSSTDALADMPSGFSLQFKANEHVKATRAYINFLNNVSEVKPGEEFTIVISIESVRTGLYWSSADVSIYSEYFDNYVTYVTNSVTLEDGTVYSNLNGTEFEKGTTPYTYHAAISFDGSDETTQYDSSKIITISATFKLSEDAENIYGTDVGFYTYPTANKFVYSDGSIDTKTAISANHPRSNQLVFTVAHGENTITYKPGTHGNEAEFTETKLYNQETLEGYSAYTISSEVFTSTGFTQVGWSTIDGGAKVYDFGDTYTANEDLVLYPAWEGTTYTITFDSKGGSEVAPISTLSGFSLTAPENPKKTGYMFKGWYLDDNTFLNAYTFTTMPAENITLYAKWEENILELDDTLTDQYEFITLNERYDDYIENDITYSDAYYYRESYASAGLTHGNEEEGARIVLGRVEPSTTIEEFLNHFTTEKEFIRITDPSGKVMYENGEVPDAIAGGYYSDEFITLEECYVIPTGAKIEYVEDGVTYDTIYVSVLGDLSKDGIITAYDYSLLRTRIKELSVNNYPLEEVLACYLENEGIYEKMLCSNDYDTLREVVKNGANTEIVPYLTKNLYYGGGSIQIELRSNPEENTSKTPSKQCKNNQFVYYKKDEEE